MDDDLMSAPLNKQVNDLPPVREHTIKPAKARQRIFRRTYRF